jgi:hypothetical protein
MRVLPAASFEVAVASALGRRHNHGLGRHRHQIRDYPHAVMIHTDQTGRSLLEDFQLW